MRYWAALSFTEPPGFMNSAFTAMVHPVLSLSLFSLIRGVLPIEREHSNDVHGHNNYYTNNLCNCMWFWLVRRSTRLTADSLSTVLLRKYVHPFLQQNFRLEGRTGCIFAKTHRPILIPVVQFIEAHFHGLCYSCDTCTSATWDILAQ